MLTLISLLLLAAGPAVSPQQPSTDAAVTQALLDYAEGFYGGEPARTARAVSPYLAKRMRTPDPTGVLLEMNADMLIDAANGAKLSPEARKMSTEVLEVSGRVASARVFSAQFNDYVHLVERDGRWQIVNVLWHAPPPAGAPAPTAAVADAARAFVDALATANGDQLLATTHPAARVRTYVSVAGRPRIVNDTAPASMALMMKMGRVKPHAVPPADVRVLGIDGDIASARATVNGATQYLHLTLVAGQWRVVNVLGDMPAAR